MVALEADFEPAFESSLTRIDAVDEVREDGAEILSEQAVALRDLCGVILSLYVVLIESLRLLDEELRRLSIKARVSAQLLLSVLSRKSTLIHE